MNRWLLALVMLMLIAVLIIALSHYITSFFSPFL